MIGWNVPSDAHFVKHNHKKSKEKPESGKGGNSEKGGSRQKSRPDMTGSDIATASSSSPGGARVGNEVVSLMQKRKKRNLHHKDLKNSKKS